MSLRWLPKARRIGKLYKVANAARDRREWARATAAYREIVAAAPDDAAAWVQLGHAIKESGAPRDAEAAYLRAAALMPADADLQLQLGHLYKILGLRDAWIAAYRAAHALDPTAADPVRELGAYGVGLFERFTGPGLPAGGQSLDTQGGGGPMTAGSDFENALVLATRHAPSDHRAFEELGRALTEANKPAAAERALQTALALKPSGDAHFKLGFLYEKMGRWSDAVHSYNRALDLSPTLLRARERALQLRQLEDELPAPVAEEVSNSGRVFVIRGDINSTTGYAKAARALANQIQRSAPVLGWPIHLDPRDNKEAFPFPLVSDSEVQGLAHRREVVVVHHALPEDLVPLPYTRNVSAFYWETEAAPHQRGWRERLAFADAVWAPTNFVGDIVRRLGFEKKLKIVPWAHSFDLSIGNPQELTSRVEAMVLDAMPADGQDRSYATSLAKLRGSTETLYIAIQSVAPRKGLPILLEEWLRHVAANPHIQDRLLLKLNFRHATNLDRFGSSLLNLVQSFGVRPGTRLRLALVDQHLSDASTLALLQQADGYVSCTYGEGFGGPVVESLAVGTPVLVPRHTGISDLVPADYPFLIDYAEHCLTLSGNAAVYPPGSTWRLPKPGALCAALARFSASSAPERKAAAAAATAHAEAFCGMDAAGRRVDDALRSL